MEPEENKPEENTNDEPVVETHDEPVGETAAEPEDGSDEDIEQAAPADALSRTPDELEEDQAAKASADDVDKSEANKPAEKKLSPMKRVYRRVNVYALAFVLLTVVGGAIVIVNYLNSQKPPQTPSIASQALTEDALKQLANTDTQVGKTSQTLTIQGNAVIEGQTLARGNLNIARNLQTGGSIQGPSLTISGKSNLGETQINSLQVAQNTAIQGDTTLRNLNVAGTSTFGGAMTASQITVTKLILSGSGTLQLPNHLSFSGASPGRSLIGSGILGSGGSVSINGSDTSGSINIRTGNNPQGSGCIVRIDFRQHFSGQPRVIISPINSAAGAMRYYVERTKENFKICTNNTPIANKNLAFDYFVAG